MMDNLCLELQEQKSKHPDPETAKNPLDKSKEEVNDGSLSNATRASAFYIITKAFFVSLNPPSQNSFSL